MVTEQLQNRRPTDLPQAERVKAMIAVGITVVLWASAFVAIRDVGHVLSPGPLALVRIGVAAAALTVVGLARVARTRAAVPVSRRSLLLIALYGVLWLAGYTVVLNAGEQHVDAGTAALLVNIAPLLVAFGAGVFLGEGYPRALIVGSLVAFGGVGIIALDSGGQRDWTGVLLCVAAALLYAAGVLIQKAALRGVDGFTATWFACVAGFVVLLPWLPETVGELASAPPGAILGAVYLGLFPTAIGFSTWAYALRRTEAGRLTATTYAVPAVSVLLSSVLLGEVPSVLGLLGGAVCLAGVAISRGRARAARATAA
ncbi:Permease of the drug/metabolite transporter (DMT) superfamily [Prauserella marina]|uniref:Permease of the drug/metabolite transporter (DMT) superfamily n=1 Tax=Prauserella marina TaxID=530584 RepID=A0A1G6YNV8_9PSEU|nr:drug/metabolite transporter (DMT)-like permease [Prauserella marina]SDD92001.1 Permease of the drug/metabolite transporter (DMT) superfamily [Prauserella marina]